MTSFIDVEVRDAVAELCIDSSMTQCEQVRLTSRAPHTPGVNLFDTSLQRLCENSIEHVEDRAFFSVTPGFSPVPVRGRPETVLTVFNAVRGNR